MFCLFLTVAKKYEILVSRAVVNYLTNCKNPIDSIFMVCHNAIDLDKIKKELKSYIDTKIEVLVISDSEAFTKLGYNKVEYISMVKDRWRIQQFIKLNCDILTGRNNCILTDVDALLVHPINYFKNNELVIFHTPSPKERINPQRDLIFKTLFPEINLNAQYMDTSYVVENSLFEHIHLVEIRKRMGDIKDFRHLRHSLYDMTLSEFKQLSLSEITPTTRKNNKFKDAADTVIWESLDKQLQQTCIEQLRHTLPDFHNDFIIKEEAYVWFSEYSLYSIYMSVYHPEKITYQQINVNKIFPTNSTMLYNFGGETIFGDVNDPNEWLL